MENKFPERKRLRLTTYDYSRPGMYFVTVCARDLRCLFGEMAGDEMRMNECGRMVESVWHELPDRFPNIELDQFVVMPNHVHGIIAIMKRMCEKQIVGAAFMAARAMSSHNDEMKDRAATRAAPTLGEIIGAFKSITTLEYVRGVTEKGWPSFSRKVWQRNYYEHVIRNDRELNEIRQYIINNPPKWELDPENTAQAVKSLRRDHGQ